MFASLDRNHRAVRVAGGALAALMISVVLANVLWPGPPSPAVSELRMPPDQSPFPTFSVGPVLRAARVRQGLPDVPHAIQLDPSEVPPPVRVTRTRSE